MSKRDLFDKFHSRFGRKGEKVGEDKASLKEKETKKSSKEQPEYGCVPSKFWYSFFGGIVAASILRPAFGMKLKTDKKIKELPGPLVIVGNHPSFIDPAIMGIKLKGRPINFVAGDFLFRKPIFGRIITKGGCIPKAQFRNDLRTVRAMMRVLGRGGVLGIFPEGTRFTDGRSIRFESGLASIVKKAGATVVIFRSHGAYMTWPRWSQSSWRRGRITAEFTDVLPKEKVQEMSVEEIHRFMSERLDYNEYEYFADHPQVFKSKAPAAGIQNIANICPRCQKINTTRIADGKGDSNLPKEARKKQNLIVCSACGNRVIMNARGFFEPAGPEDKCFPDLHEWAKWEKKIYESEAAKEGFVLTEKVSLFKLCGERYHAKVGEGILTVKDGVITYEGTECAPEDGILYKKGKPVSKYKDRDISASAKKVTKTYPIAGMKGMLMDYGKFVELFEPKEGAYRYVPENRQRLYEIQSIVMAMKDQKDS